MTMKACKVCGETFPADRQHFGSFKNKRNGIIKIGLKGTCRSCDAKRARQHYRDNPEIYEAKAARRRELMRDAGLECSDADKAALRRKLDGRCRYCNARFNGSEELDHLTPVARGGTNEIGNLTYACHACNRAKGSKTLDEFISFCIERGEPVRTDTPPGEAPSPITRAQIRVTSA